MSFPDPSPVPPARRSRTGAAGGVLLLLGCAAACSLPVILGSGAAVGALALLAGRQGVAVSVVAVVAGFGALLLWRRRRATPAAGACGCGCQVGPVRG